MSEMVRRFLRQRFGSPAIVTALGLLGLLTALQAALSNPESAFGTGILAVALIAAGSVSRDASGGALQMILARPIRRTAYLFGRYLGILTVYAIYLGVVAGLTSLCVQLIPVLSGPRPAAFSGLALARGVATALLNAALFAAILLFFSTFLRGYADVLAYVVLQVALGAIPMLGAALKRPGIEKAGEALRSNVLPNVAWGEVLRGHQVLAEPTGRWVFAVTAFLILAAVIFSRREFAYGQD